MNKLLNVQNNIREEKYCLLRTVNIEKNVKWAKKVTSFDILGNRASLSHIFQVQNHTFTKLHFFHGEWQIDALH